jgi:hypothetical protein
MVSGLRINFFKSSLIGVNVDGGFMDMACNFLNCSEGNIPFKYLGLPVGANARSMSTWEPLVENLNGKLKTWGHKHISFGGRIVLLNSVLNAIPIFYLSGSSLEKDCANPKRILMGWCGRRQEN